jgi:DNA-directed RNA polymerase subunit M/transcription elongation factor TFIIS
VEFFNDDVLNVVSNARITEAGQTAGCFGRERVGLQRMDPERVQRDKDLDQVVMQLAVTCAQTSSLSPAKDFDVNQLAEVVQTVLDREAEAQEETLERLAAHRKTKDHCPRCDSTWIKAPASFGQNFVQGLILGTIAELTHTGVIVDNRDTGLWRCDKCGYRWVW